MVFGKGVQWEETPPDASAFLEEQAPPHSGQQQFDQYGNYILPSRAPQWTYAFAIAGASIAFAIAVAAIVVAGIAYSDIKSYDPGFQLRGVCNWGVNTGLDLSSFCEDEAGIPGLNLVSGDPLFPRLAFVRRLLRGVGVNTTSFPDSHIEIGALVESLSPQLVVGVGNETVDGDRPITIALDLIGLNVSSLFTDGCTITGNGTAGSFLELGQQTPGAVLPALGSEPVTGFPRDKIIAEFNCTSATNLYVSFPYAGYSLIVGDGHTAPNDGTLDRSSILGGVNNTFNTSAFAVIGAGLDHQILNSNGGSIISGQRNIVDNSPFSGIGAGQNNTILNVTSNNAYILAGLGNSITGGTASVIAGGTLNVNNGLFSFIGTGDTNVITANATRSAILTGANNTIGDLSGTCTNCVILSGNAHTLGNTNNAVILAGNSITASGADFDNTAITQHLLVTQAVRTTGTRTVTTAVDIPTEVDHILLVNTTAAAAPVNITLLSTLPDGTNIVVKDIGNATAFNITVFASGNDLCPIGGPCAPTGSQAVTTQGGSTSLIKALTQWLVIDN